MRNPYRAQVPVTIGGERLTLQFDYEALGLIRSQIGPDQALIAVLQGHRPEMMPVLIAIGLMRNHPDWTAERIKAGDPPPYQPMVQAVEEALNAFWFGPSGPPDAPTNPLMRIARRAMKLLSPFGRRSAQA